MVIKAGSLVYIKLDDFNPPWRQAVILPEKKNKLILAVRVTSLETNSVTAETFTQFECEGCRFLLVEGTPAQVRTHCSQSMRELEVAARIVHSVGLVTLQKEDLHYALASEDVPADPMTLMRETGKGVSDSSSDSSDEGEASGKEILDLLRRAKKGGHGMATSC